VRQTHPDIARRMRAARSLMLLAWAAMLGASLAFAALGSFATPAGTPADAGGPPAASSAIAALGLICALAPLPLNRAILSPAKIAARIPLPDLTLTLRHLLAGQLALWSLAELPAILGFSQLLLGGALSTHLALCSLALANLALLLPTENRIRTRVDAVLHSSAFVRERI